MKVSVVKNILEANDRIALENRAIFDEKDLLVFNLMSSPGAGKTSLLEKTVDALKEELKIGVIEGDIQSSQDAERIAEKGIPVVQINTGGACHLEDRYLFADVWMHPSAYGHELTAIEIKAFLDEIPQGCITLPV